MATFVTKDSDRTTLALQRRTGERIRIETPGGDVVWVTLVWSDHRKARIAVEADRAVTIDREETWDAKEAERRPPLAPEPPETCLICGEPATTDYPPDCQEAAPSCGRAVCELRMQAAQDFHDEH